MAFLIDSLIGNPVQRHDERRLSITKRPLPQRPRDFFELFAAMGANATIEGLFRGVDLKGADPRLVFFMILERWPANEELAALETPYRAPAHIRALLRTAEFRTPICRRLCEVFQERQRLLYVRIPRCAGQHVMAMMEGKHPVVPLDFGTPKFKDPDLIVRTLGALLGLFGNSRTLVVVQPHIAAFLAPPARQVVGEDPLHWELSQPPCRATDRLFAIIRPPEDILLSQVNALLTALRLPPAGNEPADVAAARIHHAPLPPSDQLAQWKQLGQRLLAGIEASNPICTALGDGTAESALATCVRSPIELVGLDGYSGWARRAFDAAPPDPINVSSVILQREDLTPEEAARLADLTSEDRIFYERFAKRCAIEGLPNVKGFDL
jgi:hypothetical protein